MKPTSPVLANEFKDQEVVYAKDQPEYIPLPVLRNRNGVLLSRWVLTDEERKEIARGADIFLSNWTFNQPLQPVRIEVGECDRNLNEIAVDMDLEPKERYMSGWNGIPVVDHSGQHDEGFELALKLSKSTDSIN